MLPRVRLQKIKKTALKVALFGFAVFFIFSFFEPTVVFAAQQDFFGTTYGQETGLGDRDIRETIARIIRVILGLIGIVVLMLVIYAGYMIMTAQGDDEKVNQGKKILRNAVIGLAIIMSAFAIVSFIISQLSSATGSGRGDGSRAGQVVFQSFGGSGGLGRIVKDHYPFRNARGIARNARIVVTFTQPIDPESVIDDTNGNGTFGDCLDVPDLNWEQHCDRIKPGSVKINRYNPDIPQEENRNEPIDAVALALYEGQDNKVLTFVFKPLEYLGSDEKEMLHTVRLTNDIIKFDDSTPAFDGLRTPYYEWEFITSTELDLDGPQVESTYPLAPRGVGDNIRFHAVPRNTIVQINFNEAMDPTSVQGILDDANRFTNVIFKRTNGEVVGEVEGEWHVANAYRTIEFTPSEACGQNSCGETMYCLPTACALGDANCRENYEILIRTARAPEGKFEAFPFTGVTDIAGNALDGDADGQYDGKPNVADPATIGDEEKNPDNYDSAFLLKNVIDRTSPYVRQVSPALDAEDVQERQELKLTFSKPMWLSTLGRMRVEEYGPVDQLERMDEFWYSPVGRLIQLDENDPESVVTESEVRHRVFGANGLDLFYFPIVPSNVKGVNQNCVYPGRGPYAEGMGQSPVCRYEENEDGVLVLSEGCALVKTNANQDTACINTIIPTNFSADPADTDDILFADVEACLNDLRNASDGLIVARDAALNPEVPEDAPAEENPDGDEGDNQDGPDEDRENQNEDLPDLFFEDFGNRFIDRNGDGNIELETPFVNRTGRILRDGIRVEYLDAYRNVIDINALGTQEFFDASWGDGAVLFRLDFPDDNDLIKVIRLTIDANNEVEESNEDNNTIEVVR